MYHHGQGGVLDLKKAKKLYKKAIALGYKPSKVELKKLYVDETSIQLTKNDYSKFEKATRTGNIAVINYYLKNRIKLLDLYFYQFQLQQLFL